MTFVRGGETSFFSEDTYQEFIKQKNYCLNERLRKDEETIFDAVLSEEADFTKSPEGKEILDAIRSFE